MTGECNGYTGWVGIVVGLPLPGRRERFQKRRSWGSGMPRVSLCVEAGSPLRYKINVHERALTVPEPPQPGVGVASRVLVRASQIATSSLQLSTTLSLRRPSAAPPPAHTSPRIILPSSVIIS